MVLIQRMDVSSAECPAESDIQWDSRHRKDGERVQLSLVLLLKKSSSNSLHQVVPDPAKSGSISVIGEARVVYLYGIIQGVWKHSSHHTRLAYWSSGPSYLGHKRYEGRTTQTKPVKDRPDSLFRLLLVASEGFLRVLRTVFWRVDQLVMFRAEEHQVL